MYFCGAEFVQTISLPVHECALKLGRSAPAIVSIFQATFGPKAEMFRYSGLNR
jgi:hypothetical protein